MKAPISHHMAEFCEQINVDIALFIKFCHLIGALKLIHTMEAIHDASCEHGFIPGFSVFTLALFGSERKFNDLCSQRQVCIDRVSFGWQAANWFIAS